MNDSEAATTGVVEPKGAAGTPWWRHAAALAAVFAVTLIVFGQVVRFDWLSWDDPVLVLENPYFNPPTAANLYELWRRPYAYLYVPVTYTVMGLEATVARSSPVAGAPAVFDPAIFHAVSLALHLTCVALVYGLLFRLVRRVAAAAAGTLFFAIHPLQAESVAWVSEQKGLVAGVLGLSALLLYLESRPLDGTAADEPRHLGRYFTALTLYALALLSKPIAVAIPLVACVLEIGALGRRFKDSATALAPWIVLAVLLALQTSKLQIGSGGIPNVALWARPLLACDTVSFYGYKTIWPVDLATDYGRTPARVISGGWLYYTWPVPILCLALMSRLPAARRWLTATLVFVVALAAVSGLVPFGYQSISTVADRYAYLALLGPALGIAWLLAAMGRPVVCLVAAVVLVVLGWVAHGQAALWRDDRTLFSHNLRLYPDSWVSHERLAAVAVRQEDFAAAAQHYQAALDTKNRLNIKPDLAKNHTNLGLALWRSGRLEEAEKHFRAALQLKPRAPSALFGLGVVLIGRGDKVAAREQLQAFAEVAPEELATHYQVALAWWRAGELAEAQRVAEYCARLAPAFAEAQLAVARLAAAGNHPGQALPAYRAVVRLRPDWLAAAGELAWILATQRAADYRDADEALALTERIVSQPPTAAALDVRAAALAEAGRYEEAAKAVRQAADLAGNTDSVLANAIRDRAAHYESGRPFRQPGAAIPGLAIPGDLTPKMP